MAAPRVPNGRSSLTALTWLFQEGILEELNSYYFPPYAISHDYAQRAEQLRIETTEDLLSDRSSCLDFCSDLIDRFANACDDDPYLYDAYHLAEILQGWNRARAKWVLVDDGSVHVGNYKYQIAITSYLRPFVAYVSHLLHPQVFPAATSYEVRAGIARVIGGRGSLPIDLLRRRLFDEGVFFSHGFLLSLIRNDPTLILRRIARRIEVAMADQLIPCWHLAAELIPDEKYVDIVGNGVREEARHDAIRYEVKLFSLQQFFRFHGCADIFEQVDPIELCLKLRFRGRYLSRTVQNIPSAVHSYITKWIKEHDSIWLTRKSKSILGYEFVFDPRSISPGELMVYGNNPRFLKPREAGLVHCDMVSEGPQRRGKIHRSRVLSSFDTFELAENTQQVDALLQAHPCFESYGIIDARWIAKRVLSAQRIPATPYYEELAVKFVTKRLKESMFSVGYDIFVDESYKGILEKNVTLPTKRRLIFDSLRPRHLGPKEFLEISTAAEAECLVRLCH